MSDSIIVGFIAAAASIIASLLTAQATQRKFTQELHEQNAVQNVKIDHLAEEVRVHNNFARRMPVVEEQVSVLNREMKETKQDIREIKAKVS